MSGREGKEKNLEEKVKSLGENILCQERRFGEKIRIKYTVRERSLEEKVRWLGENIGHQRG